jgi:hypothetical protein
MGHVILPYLPRHPGCRVFLCPVIDTEFINIPKGHSMTRYFVVCSLIVLAALSRLLPHPPNVAPITALALFGGAYLGRRWTFVVPIAAMLVSDLFLGFSGISPWVYASFAAIAVIGLRLQGNTGIAPVAVASLAGSTLFFIVTNFGVWLGSVQAYPHTIAGLAACYTAALPFYRNTVLGDAGYAAVLFGLYHLAGYALPSLRIRQSEA